MRPIARLSMPDLIDFQEVIQSYPGVVATLGIAAALAAALITRGVDQSTLDSVHERLDSYEDEVNRLNEARADLLARLEERGDELRRTKAELARRDSGTRAEAARPRASVPDVPESSEEAAVVPARRSRDPSQL
jgi:hypothetical protein